jgi:hypothetical protein
MADERPFAIDHHRAHFVSSHESSSFAQNAVWLAHARRSFMEFEVFRPSAA